MKIKLEQGRGQALRGIARVFNRRSAAGGSLRLFFAAGLVSLLLAGCDNTDPIYETPHPEQGQITVTTDWSGIGTGIAKPTQYVAAYGSEKLTATQDTYTFPNLLDPGDYTVYFYNDVPTIPVSVTATGASAAVNTVTAPAGASGTFIEPTPGWLFTGRLAAAVKKDTDHEFTVHIQQQVRELTLVIEPAGGTISRIESITAVLSGAAGSLDLNNGTHGTPSNVALKFVATAVPEDNNWYATVRLLGVTGAEQKLTGVIKFKEGIPQDMPLESDLSTALAGFNTDKELPLKLGGGTVETPTETGFKAQITVWRHIPRDGVTAE